MNYRIESMVLKGLAVTALAAALLAVGMITVRSGMLGGSGSAESSTVTVADAGAGGSGEAAQAGAAEEPAQEPPKATRKHIVEEGDSFYSIARKYNVSIDDIKRLNPELDVQHLTPGISVAIP